MKAILCLEVLTNWETTDPGAGTPAYYTLSDEPFELAHSRDYAQRGDIEGYFFNVFVDDPIFHGWKLEKPEAINLDYGLYDIDDPCLLVVTDTGEPANLIYIGEAIDEEDD